MIRDARHHQAHIHTAVSGQTQRLDHGLVNGQIRRGDIHRLPRPRDHLEEHILRRGVRVIVRPVHHRLAEAVGLGMVHGAVIVMLAVHFAAQPLPHEDKLPSQPPRALALQPEAAVLPAAEALDDIGVLVGNIGAAGVGDIAVDAGDLPMVAVVEVQAVHIVVYRIEDDDLHPGTAQRLHLLRRHTHHAAEIVEDQLDLYALPTLTPQNIRQAIPQLALRHDEVLQKDEALRPLHGVQHILQEFFARLQVCRPCIPVK